MNRFDVVIVGFGPTGATLANLLAGRGHRVAIVDKSADIYPLPRAITADHEALRVFQECGLADAIEAGSVPHPGTDYLGADGQVIKRFYPLASARPLAWEPTFMFAQPELEAVLRHGLKRFSQVEYFLGMSFERCEQHADGVAVHIQGRDEPLQARYLLACDGGRSAVRKQYALPVEDLAFDESWIIVDAHLRRDLQLPARCVQYCRPQRPGTYIVGPGPLRRWEIKMLPGETPGDFQEEAAVRGVLAEFTDESGLEIIRTAVYRFHALVVGQWRQGRVFLLGDAAHQMPPFMGQGLCAGVRDAVNLAWKLDLAMRHGADEAILDTYMQERKPHVKTVVEHAKEFGLIIGELDPRAARERDLRLTAEMASGRAETVRQKFIPNLAHGLLDTDAHGQLRGGAGQLFVQPWVRAEPEPWRRLDDVTGFSFLLAVRDADLLAQLPASARQEWEAMGGQYVVIGGERGWQERDGLFAAWAAEHGAQAVLVRPDRYVYGTAQDGAALNALVSSLLARLRPRALATGQA
ncbi:3-(3-hydroxy-phenyl)propionate/3-hydroxycinnamic acid hydroxylase [compost metagenome]|jgi:3-(3-hydroxy-phenyl)propionate hydroxylase